MKLIFLPYVPLFILPLRGNYPQVSVLSPKTFVYILSVTFGGSKVHVKK